MKLSLPILLSVLVIAISCNKETKPINSTLETQVDGYLKPLVDSSRIAGAVVAIYKGEERMLLKSYGSADFEFDVKMPDDGVFQIGSITKHFTGAAIMQLAEEGKLNLDDEITKYLTYNTQGKKVTIRQLLSHTSGIKGYTEMPFYLEDLAIKEFERDTLLRLMEKQPFNFEPGERLIYSNTGFFMLGLIIEKVSGQMYADYVKKNLFDKAGMINSSYTDAQAIVKKRVQGYQLGKNGLEHASYLDQTWPYAAGSLSSTAEDLVKWNNALHHEKILKEEMYKEFITPASLNDGTATRYAKGITVQVENGRKMISHGGAISGFLGEIRFYPEENISIIVLFNTSGPTRPADAASQMAEAVFGKPAEKPKQIFAGDLKKFEGTFSGPGRGKEMIAKVVVKDSILEVTTDKPRTLEFAGNNMWSNGITNYYFVAHGDVFDELRIDQVYGYLILKRTKQD